MKWQLKRFSLCLVSVFCLAFPGLVWPGDSNTDRRLVIYESELTELIQLTAMLKSQLSNSQTNIGLLQEQLTGLSNQIVYYANELTNLQAQLGISGQELVRLKAQLIELDRYWKEYQTATELTIKTLEGQRLGGILVGIGGVIAGIVLAILF